MPLVIAVALSITSFAIALVALAVNLAGLVRRPRIVAEWGYVHDQPPGEGLSIIATARRRPIEVDEIGLVILPQGTKRRQVPEWLHLQKPVRLELRVQDLPKRLEDGQSVRGFEELDSVIDQLHDVPGDAYPYVMASGTVYIARDSKVLRRLRRRVGEK